MRRIDDRLRAGQATAGPGEAHRALAAADIHRFLDRRALPTALSTPLPVPPNMPLIPMGAGTSAARR